MRPNGWMDQDETWHGGRPRARPHCVRWGPSSLQKWHSPTPQFLAHVGCGQSAGWIKMRLGTEVGLSPGDIVSDGDPGPSPKAVGQPPPYFQPMSVAAKRLDQGATSYGGRPQPWPLCVRWAPSSHPKAHSPSNFRPMSVVAKQLDGSRCHFVRR